MEKEEKRVLPQARAGLSPLKTKHVGLNTSQSPSLQEPGLTCHSIPYLPAPADGCTGPQPDRTMLFIKSELDILDIFLKLFSIRKSKLTRLQKSITE